jgi:hypothetical protein
MQPPFEEMPLFPLPDVVLFPAMLLPLHIFEQRYRAMTRDALAGDRRLVIGRSLDGPPVDEHGHPPVTSMMGIGRIAEHEALPDGRFLLLIMGEARAQIEELPFFPPYRRVRVERLEPPSTTIAETACTGLVSIATRFLSLLPDRKPEMKIPARVNAAMLADWCASQLLLKPDDRQAILETLDPEQRVRRCTELLAVQIALATQQTRADAHSRS